MTEEFEANLWWAIQGKDLRAIGKALDEARDRSDEHCEATGCLCDDMMDKPKGCSEIFRDARMRLYTGAHLVEPPADMR